MRRDRTPIRSPVSPALAVALAFAVPCALGLTGCGSDSEPEPEPEPAVASPKAMVKFKNGTRLQNELSRALALDRNELCVELGRFECFGLHTVVLGDAEAFGVGLYEPLPDTSSTTPIAVERVVLSACSKRAEVDFAALADPSATPVIFADLELNAAGELTSLDSAGVADAIDTLYRRALSRRATDSEIAHHRQLYRDVEASGRSQTPARDWAALSCFAVFTSMEALFY